jgi:T3SS negative regulator,GrlR
MWTIRFGALDQELGAGILVFETGRAFGGDSCFAYTGNYSVDGGLLAGHLRISRHSDGLPAIYPDNANEFDVSFNAQMDSDSFMTGLFSREDYPDGGFDLYRHAELPDSNG